MGNVCSSGNSHYIQRQNNQLRVTSQDVHSFLSPDLCLVLGPPVMYEERRDEPLRAGAARHGQRGEDQQVIEHRGGR